MTLTSINDRNTTRRERTIARARSAFIELCGATAANERQRQVYGLLSKIWKGQPLYCLRCHGTRGKGPHDCWVPESLLWSLIDFRAFRCPYHFGDAEGEPAP